MPYQSQFVHRPIRLAALLFGGMTFLCAACAMFLPKVDLLLFIGTGSGYCLILAFFVVGLVLALPGRAIQWWFFSGSVPVFCLVAYLLPLMYNTELLIKVLPIAGPAVLAVLGAWLTAGLVIAGAGWAKYFRGLLANRDRQDSTPVQGADQR